MRTCAARGRVIVLSVGRSVCLFVCLFVCLSAPSHDFERNGLLYLLSVLSILYLLDRR